MLGHYSHGTYRCACCGENTLEFLALDHVNGGGGQHRRKLNKPGGGSFYAYLRKQNYPDGYRVLCHNCNQSYGMYAYCPHGKGKPQ